MSFIEISVTLKMVRKNHISPIPKPILRRPTYLKYMIKANYLFSFYYLASFLL